MKELWSKFIESFDNGKSGFSARKMSAFAGVTTAIVVTFTKVPEGGMLHALYAWLSFGLLCLGIVTAEQVIKLKNGGDTSKDTN